jgi:hypothetical protein
MKLIRASATDSPLAEKAGSDKHVASSMRLADLSQTRTPFLPFGGCIMNLVEQIKNQITAGAISQLSSLIGATEGATRSAVGAAVPALLSGLSSVASNGRGAQQVVSALGKLDGSVSHLSQMLSEQPSAMLEQGSSLLQSLFGSSMLSGISNAVSHFTGIGSASMQKLLGYLAPLVFGGIAARFAGKALNAQGLTSLLADQKGHIADAMPSGFSLNDVPGLATAWSGARRTAGDVQQAGASALKWLVPVLAGLAALGLVLWLLRPRAPDVGKLNTDLTTDVTSLTDSLRDIRDVDTAQAALPKLKELNSKLDGLKAQIDKLPKADKDKFINEHVKPALAKLKDQAEKAASMPGVGDRIKATADESLAKLAALGDLPAPHVQLAHVPDVQGGIKALTASVGEGVKSLTDSLGDIKDAASAATALPKLNAATAKLGELKAQIDKLPAVDKDQFINEQIKPALAKLEEQSARLQWIPGVGAKIKSAVDENLHKIASLGDLAVGKLPQVSGELADSFTSITETLTGVKDAASAKAAVSKLQEVSGKLDSAKADMEQLPASGKNTLAALIKPALEKLRQVYDRVVALAGVSETIRAPMDAIMTKLTHLAG